MKILTILGARPQFIKASCLQRSFKKYPQFEEIIVHTGQHYDLEMSEIFFKELNLSYPNYNLQCGNKPHLEMISAMLKNLHKIILKTKPNALLVYGDTNSTLAGALSACKTQTPLIHIEAGLRSFDFSMPEESNRILTDRVSSLLFCPTQTAIQNLKNEGFENFECKFYYSGDVMKDNAIFYSKYAKKPSIPIESEFVLASIHRVQNTDDNQRFKNIFESLDFIASKTQVILPLHPKTAFKLKNQNFKLPHITFTKPLSYLEIIWLLQHTKAVFTDSGGLQKEAYFFKKPCFVLRDKSEWQELITNKCAILLKADKENIIQAFDNIPDIFTKQFPTHLYGEGNAGDFILEKILETL
ncbi:UDP-N-acetylglucosamine 2-epimerase (non-hydrolyzing) [Helicobacter sp. 13S00477-4]|uniref:non-hydrolyzing UDP-N-acetylglucosamine 2-epimerase n=1 Tax=Helicobacter sp. 13S00477-4 TaxID=1905759 RepID=UPI000BA5A165|nr:UDP-N-acetylglucosamine 2-epimerase (non-hydrolyzing) [Helicobacter sp. 13S00477-4]PAF51935.1 UDP-N-acetylglucosamine 2-epimerase [Helicobacter sp. 13S00477-4]